MQNFHPITTAEEEQRTGASLYYSEQRQMGHSPRIDSKGFPLTLDVADQPMFTGHADIVDDERLRDVVSSHEAKLLAALKAELRQRIKVASDCAMELERHATTGDVARKTIAIERLDRAVDAIWETRSARTRDWQKALHMLRSVLTFQNWDLIGAEQAKALNRSINYIRYHSVNASTRRELLRTLLSANLSPWDPISAISEENQSPVQDDGESPDDL